jgi:uncharacterized protein
LITNDRQKRKNCNQKLFEEILFSTVMNSRLNETIAHIQHGNTSVYEHSVSVAYNCYRLALFFRLPVNKKALIRGALLHDYFLYDWHVGNNSNELHGFHHPKLALKNAEEDFELSEVEKDIILKHMFPLTAVPPKYLEAILVCLVDKMCSIYEIFYFANVFQFSKKALKLAKLKLHKLEDI